MASDTAAPLQGEGFISEKTRTGNVSEETFSAIPLQGERLSEDTSEKDPKTRTGSVSKETTVDDSNDVLWVDWDGPTDPMNPKK